MRDSSEAVGKREVWLLLSIIIGALGLRFFRIGALSLSGDEETTALAALALLDGWPPTLPGGLNYLRGLPFTFLESGSIFLFGLSEASLRYVPVLVAGPRIFAIWWMARPVLGMRLALGAALMLAVSPLDVEFSRTARMYSMFMTLDLLFLAALVRMCFGEKKLFASVGSGMAAVSTHMLAVTHAPVGWICALDRNLPRATRMALAAAGTSVLVWYVAVSKYTSTAYSAVRDAVAGDVPQFNPLASHFSGLAGMGASPVGGTLLALGLIVSLFLMFKGIRGLEHTESRLVGLAFAFAVLISSPVLGLFILLCLIVLERVRLQELSARLGPLVLGGITMLATWGVLSLLANGLGASGIKETAKLMLSFPAPNWFDFALAAPLFSLLVALGLLAATYRGVRSEYPAAWIALMAAGALPFLLSGLLKRVEESRYQVHALAPMIVLCLVAAQVGLGRWVRNPRALTAASLLLVALSLRPDHALKAVTRQHGPVSEPFAAFTIAPDHRSAGAYIKSMAREGDLVAAEDMLQMQFYIGHVDMWLRRLEDADSFLFKDQATGTLHDFYTGARHIHDLDALSRAAAEEGGRVVWLATSAEVETRPEWFRTDETHETLASWHDRAWFVGEDGVTRVYRIENGKAVSPGERPGGDLPDPALGAHNRLEAGTPGR